MAHVFEASTGTNLEGFPVDAALFEAFVALILLHGFVNCHGNWEPSESSNVLQDSPFRNEIALQNVIINHILFFFFQFQGFLFIADGHENWYTYSKGPHFFFKKPTVATNFLLRSENAVVVTTWLLKTLDCLLQLYQHQPRLESAEMITPCAILLKSIQTSIKQCFVPFPCKLHGPLQEVYLRQLMMPAKMI